VALENRDEVDWEVRREDVLCFRGRVERVLDNLLNGEAHNLNSVFNGGVIHRDQALCPKFRHMRFKGSD